MVTFPGAQILDIAGPLEVFSVAGFLDPDSAVPHKLGERERRLMLMTSGVEVAADLISECEGPIDTLVVAGGRGKLVAAEDDVGDPASFSLLVGFFGWVIVMVAAAVAFRSAGASWPIVVLIGMAAIFRDPSAARRTDRTRLFRCGRCARRALARRQRSATRRSD